MNIVAYVIPGAIGLLFSVVGIGFALVSGQEFAYKIGGLHLIAYVGIIFYIVHRKKSGKTLARWLLVTPAFMVMGAIALFGIGSNLVARAEPDSEPFVAGCKNAGARYLKKPNSPVRSIGYDWNTKDVPPFNFFEVGYGSTVRSFGRQHHPHPQSIEFIERKRSSLEGRPKNGEDGPFVRFPREGDYYIVPTITADVLVRYEVEPMDQLSKAEVSQELVTYRVTVSDRRTSEQLALLQYMIDAKKRRACGFTSEKKMSEREFVLKAIGMQ